MPQTCDAITAALLAETGRYGGEAYRRTARKQPIIELVKAHAGAWEDGMGTIVSNVTTARNFPLDPVASRTNRSESDGASVDACLPPTLTTQHGQIAQSYRIRHLAVNTPEFCINDLRTEFKFAAFMGNIRKQLDDITEHVWAEWFTRDYFNVAGHKLTQQTGGVTDSSGTEYTTAPTGMIQFGTLEDIYAEISRQGDTPFARDMDTEAPVFPLLIGREAFAKLLRDNEELRQDIRWAWIGSKDESPLLPNGMPRKRRNFGGFIIYENPYPRRFNGTVQTSRVPHWISQAADKGTKQVLSSSWKNAHYEETIIFHPSNYQDLAVNTIGTPSPGWNFDPRSWMGEFSLRNILNKDCNPDGDKVFWRALFASAAAPVMPEVGYTYLHLNCGFDKSSTACPAGTSSASA